jgi:hypothetical protein
MLPYLDNEFLLVTEGLMIFYFTIWPLAKFGSVLLWMIASPPPGLHLLDTIEI